MNKYTMSSMGGGITITVQQIRTRLDSFFVCEGMLLLFKAQVT